MMNEYVSRRELEERRIIDDVKKRLKACVDDLITPFGSSMTLDALKIRIDSLMNQYVTMGTIKGYQMTAEYATGKRLKEVDCLPDNAVPGDPLIVNGVMGERFNGLVVSSDGEGNGVIFQNEPDESIHVKVWLQVRPTPDYLVIEVVREL